VTLILKVPRDSHVTELLRIVNLVTPSHRPSTRADSRAGSAVHFHALHRYDH
jgi:hypothetical protein